MKPMEQVHHLGLTVSDVERSVAFYQRFGFEVNARFESASPKAAQGTGVAGARLKVAMLRHPDVGLELIEYEPRGTTEPPRNNDLGSAHLCVEVDDIHAVYEEFRSVGVEFFSPPLRARDEVDWVYLKDPDGITVELVQPVDRADEATRQPASPSSAA